MKTERKLAVWVGILFILGTVAGGTSFAITGPLLNAGDYLAVIAQHPNRMIAAACLVLVMGLALAVVPLLVFPILKQRHPLLAAGYLLFRGALEMTTYLGIAVAWLLMANLSQAAAIEPSTVAALGSVLKAAADVSSQMTAIIFPLGALFFYAGLYQSRLIPRWLSVWGIIAVLVHLATSGLLNLFHLIDPTSPLQMILNFPIFLQEMVMAVWLIAKGFNIEEQRPPA